MLKFKMPHFDTVVPDWATINPGISLWNCFTLLVRAGIDESQSARICSYRYPKGVRVSPV
jgi:hypothetical protein